MRKLPAAIPSCFAAASLVVATAAGAQDAENGERAEEVSSLERGFRACLLQVSSNEYLTDSPAEALTEDKLGVREDPPADVRLMASRLFPEARYVRIDDDGDGTVWAVASKNVPACKVSFSDHDNPLKHRLDFSGLLFAADNWKPRRDLSGSSGGLMREAFVLSREDSSVEVLAIVEGPQTVVNNGQGIQAIVTVAAQPKKAE